MCRVLDEYGIVVIHKLCNELPFLGVRPGQRWRWILCFIRYGLGLVQCMADARVRAYLLRLLLAVSCNAHCSRLIAWWEVVPVVVGGQVVSVARVVMIKPTIIG